MQAIVLQVNTKGALNGLSDGTCNTLHRCRANWSLLCGAVCGRTMLLTVVSQMPLTQWRALPVSIHHLMKI